MKKTVLIYMLLVNAIVFCQGNKINKVEIMPGEIDFNGCVKKITVKNLRLNRTIAKIDSVISISEVSFSAKRIVEKLKLYNATMNSWRIVEFDALERIKSISIDNGRLKNLVFVNQYFSGNSEFPDSTKINNDKNFREKFVNRFTKNLVTKQEYYVNDTLQDFRIYKYNEQNLLIEDLYHNLKNETGETLVTSESNDGYKLSFYPERQILYEHKKDKDTIIVVKISPRYSSKEITKTIKNKNYELKIQEQYGRGFIQESRTTWTSKDSVSFNLNKFRGTKEITSYYNSFRNSKKIVYKSKSDFFSNQKDEEKSTIIDIETIYDKFKNWIKKTYSEKGVVQSVIERKIEYYCI